MLGEKVSGGFIITGRDSSELFRTYSEILDQMACLVHLFDQNHGGVLRPLLGGITGVLPAASRGSITRASASNALSASKVSALHLRQEHIGALKVMRLTAGQEEGKWIAPAHRP